MASVSSDREKLHAAEEFLVGFIQSQASEDDLRALVEYLLGALKAVNSDNKNPVSEDVVLFLRNAVTLARSKNEKSASRSLRGLLEPCQLSNSEAMNELYLMRMKYLPEKTVLELSAEREAPAPAGIYPDKKIYTYDEFLKLTDLEWVLNDSLFTVKNESEAWKNRRFIAVELAISRFREKERFLIIKLKDKFNKYSDVDRFRIIVFTEGSLKHNNLKKTYGLP